MTNWEDFKGSDLEIIRDKINWKYDRALIWTVVLTVPLMFISPYIPSKRGRGRLIDRMEYWDAVLYFTILWTVILVIVAIYNIWRSGREYEVIKRNLKKETFETKVLKKKKDFLSNQYIVNLGRFGDFRLTKEEVNTINVGELVRIEVEVTTGTVLRIMPELN